MLHKEAATLARHLAKLPSILVFKMCTADPYAHCRQVIAARRAGGGTACPDPSWSPQRVLAPLSHNDYHPYYPELPNFTVPDGAAGCLASPKYVAQEASEAHRAGFITGLRGKFFRNVHFIRADTLQP